MTEEPKRSSLSIPVRHPRPQRRAGYAQMGAWQKIPWTFWTMFCGNRRHCRDSAFAGFWSKDEIFWRAYSQGPSKIIWALGLLTASSPRSTCSGLLYHDVFWANIGAAWSRRGHDAHGHELWTRHGHGGIHESPALMLVPLVISRGPFALWRPRSMPQVPRSGLSGGIRRPRRRSSRFGNRRIGRQNHRHILQAVSVGVAVLGFFLAWLLYGEIPHLQPKSPRVSAALPHRPNKYYVDANLQLGLHRPRSSPCSRNWAYGRASTGLYRHRNHDSADATRRSRRSSPAHAVGQFALLSAWF